MIYLIHDLLFSEFSNRFSFGLVYSFTFAQSQPHKPLIEKRTNNMYLQVGDLWGDRGFHFHHHHNETES